MYGALISPAMTMWGFTTRDFACVADLEGVRRAITTHAVPNSAMRHKQWVTKILEVQKLVQKCLVIATAVLRL